MLNYSHYYHRTITNHATGFKMVLGGTGLGKTSSIRAVVRAPEYQRRKFIYCANRKQLLEEMARELDTLDPTLYIMLRRDLEVVQQTLKKQREAFYELLEAPVFLKNVQRSERLSRIARIDMPTLRHACQELEELSDEGIYLHKFVEDHAEYLAHLVLGAFKLALLAAHKSGDARSYQELADHPVVQSLFPYIAFKRRPQVRLLLVTLQKAYYGFFDGLRTLNLTRLQDPDGGYIIFLDEFDFLENDLVGLICRSPQISNPFYFIERFYSAMERHKLPLEEYPLSSNVRKRIEEIMRVLRELHAEGLHFPHIYQFTSSIPRKSSVIFRTRHTISTDPLYLYQTNRSFEIVSQPNPARAAGASVQSALRLFGAVSHACARILTLFKELEREDEIIYREMLHQCFQETVFPEQMASITHFSRSDNVQRTQMGTLLEAGYSLYDIKDLQQQTDRDEVEVRHYSMHPTPEMVLYSLIRDNLVFGLSATADISRLVHHFNLDWLAQQRVNVIPVDEEDVNIIRGLNQQKATERGNRMNTVVLDDLDQSDPYQHDLDQFLSAAAKHEDFGEDTPSGHLKRRVQLFFAALLWMCKHPSTSEADDTYLLFLNTFRQIRFVFDHHPAPEEDFYTITKRAANRWFEVYEVAIQRRRFTVVFYDAQVGSRVHQSQKVQDLFDALFWEHQPVVVVTQYLSAGNGVNLQYLPYEGSPHRKDFTHIGLLETPYFYFSKRNPELRPEERIAALKEDIWYQAKLFAGKAITEQHFRYVLSTLEESSEWNRRYRLDISTAVDALFNHISTFMQALGRVERIWTEMPDQTVLFSQDVYTRFLAFCAPEFDAVREQREPIISNNLRQIFDQVCANLSQREDEARRQRDARLVAKDEQCRTAVQRLLVRMDGVRQGSGDQEARNQWQQLRQATLKHNFGDSILQEYACVMESPYYINGELYLTPQREIIPARLTQPDTLCWRMDALFDVIADNTVIHDYFLDRGFELAFSRTTRQFFTPYCYQAILTGAIGEEAITALLLHERIKLEGVPDALFEIADLKLGERPWYIDCKNYNEVTLERFTLSVDDPTWHSKINEEHFKQNARAKLEKISRYHGRSGKLIYLNLVGSQDRPFGFYDRGFHPVNQFSDAAIVVIQGALQRQAPNEYQPAFERFLYEIKQ
jgi:hypothetical protein